MPVALPSGKSVPSETEYLMYELVHVVGDAILKVSGSNLLFIKNQDGKEAIINGDLELT